MKRTLLVFALLGVALAQHPKKAPTRPKEDPQERLDREWMCKIGSMHNCKCPAMIAEVQDEAVKQCELSTDYQACIAKLPQPCDIIQHADTKHPEHTCGRNCTKPRCGCWDGPACFGPQVMSVEDIP